MKKILIFILTIAMIALPLVAFAHSGRTDGAGGHTDHSTGEYHYHHGHEAHQHPNGECPYEVDDEVDDIEKDLSSSFISSSSSSSYSYTYTYTDSYDEGYEDGYNQGYLDGYNSGKKVGYDLGINEYEETVPTWVWVVFALCGLVIVVQFIIIKNDW